ncbi:MAG: G5 domain-containing protein, partial [Finegoldia magna]|nr:G5 domain-containing protein [Finegoldia magna]
VGKGTNDGTHEIVEKKELPFETRYEYDDSLEPGEEKIVQEGKPGLQERTNTLVIKDGKVTEVKEGEFKTITEPEERIVKIGRKPTEGEVTKTIEREIPYETKVIYDENLEAGFQKIENEGKPGKEKVTITQKIKDSKPVGDPTETTKTITEKEDRVVRIGVKPVVKEVELGHDTEYRHNPELKEGETKVIEEGSNGSIKYTTTFNKETGKLEVKEERTEPKNKVVEYGSKTDGEFTYESEKAYDIIIRENPNLEAGKTKVIQEGIVGKTETTVKIENSKEVSRDTKTITEKQDKIIEIGTKNVCEIPPVNPDPDKPGKPGDKDPENPDKPGDKDPENPDKPGDKDPENPDKPGDKDPETPGKPGDKDPGTPGKPGDKDPGTPGEDPKDPEAPGEDPKDPDKDPGKEDPKDPETPGGEDPKDPEQPGGKDPKDPEQPGGEDPKDPEIPGKTPENNGKTPENNGKTPENNGKTPGATGQVDGKSTTTNNKTPKRLPKSGSESEIMTLAMSGLLTAAGFVGLKKKRKDR